MEPQMRHFSELSPEQKEQARTMFLPAIPYQAYLYEITKDGHVLCRRRPDHPFTAAQGAHQ